MMSTSSAKATGAEAAVRRLLARAEIELNGSRPWDIQVHNPDLYRRVLAHGSVGLGEAYMDGWWDAEQLDEFFCRVMRARIDTKVREDLPTLLSAAKASLLNLQNRKRSKTVAEQHYDLGNDFYQAMLDPRMQYTCAYYQGTDDLNVAQEKKLDLMCKKLRLRPGERVLELGCGFGGFAKFAAERYGCRVTAYNISAEQVAYARDACKGLPVEIMHADYREARGTYDKVASIGMCEHVGYKNYRTLMEVVHRSLPDGGLFLLHTIGTNVSVTRSDPWFMKYIFPNSMLPSPPQLTNAAESLFVLEDWHNFGTHYDKTLLAWHRNFLAHWPQFAERYGERFKRMWEYYLLSFAGAFRARSTQLWQVVLSKNGIRGGYESVR
jgi:cyclopropane-fatty-acyl-phospholipid synthase